MASIQEFAFGAAQPRRRRQPNKRARAWLPWALAGVAVVVIFALVVMPKPQNRLLSAKATSQIRSAGLKADPRTNTAGSRTGKTPQRPTPATSAITPTPVSTTPATVPAAQPQPQYVTTTTDPPPPPVTQTTLPAPPPAATFHLSVSDTISTTGSTAVIVLSALATSNGSPLSGDDVSFSAAGCPSTSVVTNGAGVGTATINCPASALPTSLSATDSHGITVVVELA